MLKKLQPEFDLLIFLASCQKFAKQKNSFVCCAHDVGHNLLANGFEFSRKLCILMKIALVRNRSCFLPGRLKNYTLQHLKGLYKILMPDFSFPKSTISSKKNINIRVIGQIFNKLPCCESASIA